MKEPEQIVFQTGRLFEKPTSFLLYWMVVPNAENQIDGSSDFLQARRWLVHEVYESAW